jgi:hypothetical protein
MSRIYAVIGTNSMTVVADSVRYNPQTNEVLMQSERPSEGDWIANEEGEWVEDKQKKLEELDAQYNADKSTLSAEYTDALMNDDAELADEIKAELVALNEDYDKAYEEIVGGE